MKILIFLFGSLLSLSVFAQAVKTDSCNVTHPPQLVWQKPDQFIWTGGCLKGMAQGYGWYKFDLKNDGYPSSRVEILVEVNKGEVSNSYYYVKMFSQEQLTFEGFAQLGGYQIDARNCLSVADCVRTADVLKNGVRPPLPPKAPERPPVDLPVVTAPTPTPLEPNEPEETFPPRYDSIAEAKQKFHALVEKTTQYMYLKVDKEFNGAKNIKEGLTIGMEQFATNFDAFAAAICQRRGALVVACVIHQYERAGSSLGYFLRDASIRSVVFPTNYKSFLPACGGNKNNRNHFVCWQRKIEELVASIKQRHPNGGHFGAEAFRGYSWAVSYFDHEDEYSTALDKNYESLIFYLYEQANTNW